ncbi:hypothetical protein [Vreelandella populi]|uniref:Uncharacterized protein n=1 Tax=Vreelandella populi TaxID=2498858 RepID=A0A433LAF6_9GAMM|nr:hypothetical protein [Halomonas populi]RUR36500.1 hypothetical protein ELY25_12630 [Halomonas populi]RUR44961.1 hypothetical protein ELY37_12860 [Halomonas populi]
MEQLYNSFANTPLWIVLALICIGFGIAGWRKWKSVNDRHRATSLEASSSSSKPQKLLGKVEVYVGIAAGIVGSISGLIQIGVFFGWWPEVLG